MAASKPQYKLREDFVANCKPAFQNHVRSSCCPISAGMTYFRIARVVAVMNVCNLTTLQLNLLLPS